LFTNLPAHLRSRLFDDCSVGKATAKTYVRGAHLEVVADVRGVREVTWRRHR